MLLKLIRNVAVVLCLLPLPAQAEIYQWVDAEGRVHFSDAAPEGHESETITPNTERMGVRLSSPREAEAWSDQVLNPAASPASPQQAAPARRATARVLNDWETDLCAGVVGDCFTEQQDYVCKLRFGLACRQIYHWKVCLQQDCKDKKIADQCDSPFHLLDRRPAVLTRRDLGRPLPLQQLVTERDWQCLSQHGFFCDEVAFENACQERYGQSCEAMKNWVTAARQRCKQQRGSDCDSVDGWKQFRPVSVAESKKAGTRLASGGFSSHDYLLESLGVEQDDPAHYPQLQNALESLTGLNIRPRRRSFDCDAGWKLYR